MQAALDEPASAPIAPALRHTLQFLAKVTRDHEAVGPADVRALLDAGLDRRQIEDALDVAFAFNVITRLADTFRFHVGPRSMFEASARVLLTRGYRL